MMPVSRPRPIINAGTGREGSAGGVAGSTTRTLVVGTAEAMPAWVACWRVELYSTVLASTSRLRLASCKALSDWAATSLDWAV